LFSNAALNGMYSFHASTAAYTEFWNNNFSETQSVSYQPISHCHIWQAFVQESIHTISAASNIHLELKDGLAIDEVAKEAFEILGQNGVIRAADQHACSECTHKYKKRADRITGDDPAAVVDNDENHVVPPLLGEGAVLAARDAAVA
jgi:nitrate/TMAO reductase-like tetraheme cytochrome c subunit